MQSNNEYLQNVIFLALHRSEAKKQQNVFFEIINHRLLSEHEFL